MDQKEESQIQPSSNYPERVAANTRGPGFHPLSCMQPSSSCLPSPRRHVLIGASLPGDPIVLARDWLNGGQYQPMRLEGKLLGKVTQDGVGCFSRSWSGCRDPKVAAILAPACG